MAVAVDADVAAVVVAAAVAVAVAAEFVAARISAVSRVAGGVHPVELSVVVATAAAAEVVRRTSWRQKKRNKETWD